MASSLIQLLGGGLPAGDLTSLLRKAIQHGCHALSSRDFQHVSDIFKLCSHTLKTNPGQLSTEDAECIVRKLCFPVMSAWSGDGSRGDRPADEADVVQAAGDFLCSLLMSYNASRSHHESLTEMVMTNCIEVLSHYRDELHSKSQLCHNFGEEEDPKAPCNLSISSVMLVLEKLCQAEEMGKEDRAEKGKMKLSLRNWWKEITDVSLNLLESAEPRICVQLAQILVPRKELPWAQSTSLEMFRLVWGRFLKLHAHAVEYSESIKENVYLVLCALSDTFLPGALHGEGQKPEDGGKKEDPTTSGLDAASPGVFNILESEEFWMLIQHGLLHANPLTRKRSAHLMKRAIDVAATQARCIAVGQGIQELSQQPLFSWDPSTKDRMLKTWLEFFLIYETLDEVQIHVVTPVMPRLANITKATYIPENNQALPLLHSTWLSILYQRTFVHESKTVTRLGVVECLNLDIGRSSFLQQCGIQLILGPLLTALHEEYLYTKPPDVAPGSHPPIGLALKKFLPSCMQLLPQNTRSEFLTKLLELICGQSWGPVTIFFFAEALAAIPPCSAWGLASLHLLRDKLSSGFLTCPAGYRTSIQCFLLRAGLNLLDWDAVSLHQVSSLLGVCSATEVLKRGSPVWHEVCQALQHLTEAHPSGSSPNPSENPKSDRGSLLEMCLQEVKGYLHVDPTPGHDVGGDLPNPGEAQRVAVTILLVADAQRSLRSTDEPMFISRLLQPVTEVLGRAGSHVYLHPFKADKAIQLLETLLRESGQPEHGSIDGEVMQCLTSLLGQTFDEIVQYVMQWLIGNSKSQTFDVGRVALYKSFLDAVVAYVAKSGITQPKTSKYQSAVSGVVDGRRRLLQGCQMLMKAQGSEELSESQKWYQSFVLMALLSWQLDMDVLIHDAHMPSSMEMLSALMAVDATSTKPREIKDGRGADRPDRGRLQSDLICSKWEAMLAVVKRLGAPGCSARDGENTDAGDRKSQEVGAMEKKEGPGDEKQMDTVTWQQVLSACVADIGLVSAVHAVPLLQCAAILIPKVIDANMSLCLEASAAAWCSVQDGWRSNLTFWCVYEAFITLAFQPALLQYGEDSEVFETLQKYTKKILAQGETRLGMLNCLLSHLARMLHREFFAVSPDLRSCDAMSIVWNLSGILQEAALFGPVISKSVRLMEDVSAYLLQHEGLDAAKPIIQTNSNSSNPRYPRVYALEILMQIGTSDLEGKEEFFEHFIMNLLEKDQEITPPKRSYIINSSVHRIKLRIWQAVIVIMHFMSATAAARVMKSVLRSLRAENQTSTRHLIEVFVVRLIHLHPHLLQQFWEYTAEVANDQEVSFSPLIMIIAHLGLVQPTDQQESFYMHAIPTILPWTFVPAMAMRTQSQVALFKMWRDCKEAGLTAVIDRFPGVAVCMDFTQNNSALHQLRERMEGSFFLRFFHPLDDFSLETILRSMPYLTLVTEDEWVEPELFLSSSTSPWRPDGKHPIMPLYSRTDALRTCKLIERKKTTSVKDGEIREESWMEDGSGDVQKKITPLKEWHIPGFKPSPEGQRSSSKGHLVVVASLVDRIPNLGGLCRTCEIFGASCLVLGNIFLKDHQDFLSLSVSAERWLPIREVKPNGLKAYMIEMKQHGYALVGVEQTANSQPLTDFKFPQRTMLLLGKEREGIPADLIQLLDVCVEIPQLGFIRSLNVHVSGALMIWEYTRQKLLQS